MNKIKMQYVGCRVMIGTSKSGKPYEMVNMYYIVPAEASVSNLQTRHEAFGLEVKDKPISIALYEATEKLDIVPLSWVFVDIGIDPENIDRTVITSIEPEKSGSSTARATATANK